MPSTPHSSLPSLSLVLLFALWPQTKFHAEASYKCRESCRLADQAGEEKNRRKELLKGVSGIWSGLIRWRWRQNRDSSKISRMEKRSCKEPSLPFMLNVVWPSSWIPFVHQVRLLEIHNPGNSELNFTRSVPLVENPSPQEETCELLGWE